jgi:SAM-dependent methyltransferase
MTFDRSLAESWDRNAANWTRVVREGLIPSRKAGTDAAILRAIAERSPRWLLDIGCGEGWLIRAAEAITGCAGVGIDGSAELIAAAQAADSVNRYAVLDYAAFAAGDDDVGGDFDIAVFNYALFAEDIAPLLRAAATRLTSHGALIIQTLHPGAGGEHGWRTEDFAAFGTGDWAPMPWYARSVDGWRGAVAEAGLKVAEMREPKAEDGRVLSLLMVCVPPT